MKSWRLEDAYYIWSIKNAYNEASKIIDDSYVNRSKKEYPEFEVVL